MVFMLVVVYPSFVCSLETLDISFVDFITMNINEVVCYHGFHAKFE